MSKKNFKKYHGFTLVELMIVVSIIGILATIVFASIGDARAKARDKSIIITMRNMQGQAELFASEQGTDFFTDICNDPKIIQMKSKIEDITDATVTCNATRHDYVFSTELINKSGKADRSHYCIDSNGVGIETSGPVTDPRTGCPAR